MGQIYWAKRAYYLSFDLSFNLAREHNDGNFLTFEIIKGINTYTLLTTSAIDFHVSGNIKGRLFQVEDLLHAFWSSLTVFIIVKQTLTRINGWGYSTNPTSSNYKEWKAVLFLMRASYTEIAFSKQTLSPLSPLAAEKWWWWWWRILPRTHIFGVKDVCRYR